MSIGTRGDRLAKKTENEKILGHFPFKQILLLRVLSLLLLMVTLLGGTAAAGTVLCVTAGSVLPTFFGACGRRGVLAHHHSARHRLSRKSQKTSFAQVPSSSTPQGT